MKVPSPITASHGGNPGTLAQVLASGPVPLPAAMQYATDIAAALREIHERGQSHGKVIAANVVIVTRGAELLPSRSAWDRGDTARDIREFGALLFHLLTGDPLKPGDIPAHPRLTGLRNSAAGLRASALQIAACCFAESRVQPTMQQVLTELRLLAVLLKMPDKSVAPLPPVPFLVASNPPPVRRTAAPPPIAAAPIDPHVIPGESGSAPLVPLGPASFGQPSAVPPSEISERGGRCPKCDCTEVFVSRPRSRFENLLVRMKVPICRCHRCYHRYFVFSRFKIGKEMPVGPARKHRPHRRKR